MALIDEPRAKAIYDAMGPAVEISGGSAANTIVGVASFGARAAFVGKVKDDELGKVFAHDIRAAGVAFDTPPAADGPVDRALLHPGDAGRRAHHEHLPRRGAEPDSGRRRRRCGVERVDHLSRRLSVGSAAGQGGVPQGREDRARRRAPGGADAVGCVLRRTLSRGVRRSDPRRHRRSRVRQRDRAARASTRPPTSTRRRRRCAPMRSSRSSRAARRAASFVSKDGVEAVPAMPIAKMVDATGAGDLFAAGFLFGLARGRDHRTAARLGVLAAAEVIQHHRRAAGDLAEGSGAEERPAGVMISSKVTMI